MKMILAALLVADAAFSVQAQAAEADLKWVQ